MRTMQSNNPVFQRSEPLARSLQHGTGFHPAPSADEVSAIYTTPQRMTLDDVIVKTGILLGIIVVLGAGAWITDLPLGAGFLAGLVGFGLAMVNIFKKQVSPPLVLAYAAAQGVFIGTISHAYNSAFGGGIVVQAVLGTAAVFGAVLVGYRSGKLRATPKFTKIVTFGLMGMVGLVVVNFLISIFSGGDALGIRGGNLPLSILVSVGLITFGALTFVLDFDQADKMVAAGVPEQESWRVSFGLVVGLVFLYLEILRLLSYLQGRD